MGEHSELDSVKIAPKVQSVITDCDRLQDLAKNGVDFVDGRDGLYIAILPQVKWDPEKHGENGYSLVGKAHDKGFELVRAMEEAGIDRESKSAASIMALVHLLDKDEAFSELAVI